MRKSWIHIIIAFFIGTALAYVYATRPEKVPVPTDIQQAQARIAQDKKNEAETAMFRMAGEVARNGVFLFCDCTCPENAPFRVPHDVERTPPLLDVAGLPPTNTRDVLKAMEE